MGLTIPGPNVCPDYQKTMMQGDTCLWVHAIHSHGGKISVKFTGQENIARKVAEEWRFRAIRVQFLK